ncbi:MAG: hypothetical protein QM689_12725 [Oscillospiraceae bacterium]
MTIRDLGAALAATGIKTHHYSGYKSAFPYIVWAEDGENSSYADGKRSTKIITGTTDYFTETEYDDNAAAIENAMAGIGLAFRLNTVLVENKPSGGIYCIHYEWAWEAVADG